MRESTQIVGVEHVAMKQIGVDHHVTVSGGGGGASVRLPTLVSPLAHTVVRHTTQRPAGLVLLLTGPHG